MTDDIVARLRDIEGGYGFRAICREAAEEIERLRAERDEARREVCAIYADTYGSVGLVAERRGWNCFKEASDGRG